MRVAVEKDAAFVEVAAELEAISLEEINREGSLQVRRDRKYLLTGAEAVDLLEWLRTCDRVQRCRVMEHQGSRHGRYASTYFDTPQRLCYRMGVQKARRRFKVRTREYMDSNLMFLEVKTKSSVGTVKQRIPWHRANTLGPEGHDFVAESIVTPRLADEGGELFPALQTRYTRTTALCEERQGVRITFDRNLRWNLPSFERLDRGGQAATDTWIVETKTSGHACAADHYLWRHDHRPQSVSKYMVGVAQFAPELPRQRWTRAIATMTGGIR